MAVNPFVLLPLYIYPEAGLWNPLFTAASAHPNVEFQVIVNPWTGPGAEDCPDDAFTAAMQQVHEYDNIKTLGYVHTANSWDCGASGSDICVTTAAMEELKANVTKYNKWGSDGCGGVPVDGIFFDESPYTANSDFVSYMREAAAFARKTLTHGGNNVMFNAGAIVEDEAYWQLADWICTLEGVLEDQKGQGSIAELLDQRTGGGEHGDQTAVILYGYGGGTQQLEKDVARILDAGVVGLSVTDTAGYVSWSDGWMDFVGAVDEAVSGQ